MLSSRIQLSLIFSSSIVNTFSFLVPSSSSLLFSSSRKIDYNFDRYQQSLFSTFTRIALEESKEPIPFVDVEGSSFIECYVDSLAEIDGIRYTIGVPCDHSVALCCFNDRDELVPVGIDDKLMDDVFPIAESIVIDEFGEELALQRTPQTLTLLGELDDEEEGDFDDNDIEGREENEEVEELLSFEHQDKEFKLVRLLDPVLLVGKDDGENDNRRLLLTQKESIKVMPKLEKMFLEHIDDVE
mmetsp:Transcript_16617/g.19154  ORF Transcript_16617/g.19154 Transcript_16617/m.19154 type:complete len:242 (+) Transcript_16617:92-817(+)|eukprot:CAMPEP_0194145954 /NCGR_PEP_ID=MMETSP0152-20130528/18957_1 /TAXON_ID=1049557 /ORGANISM="Thalassiothrix antarctica, Strain L6-D1" /LENGTH=241 /DNA_ID=CAMNT_0038846337 /DNA_START=67 /DNA_END=792 /DNA_ORIENTATION=+